MTTCIQDYLSLSNEELVTMVLVSDREDDMIRFLTDEAVTELDLQCQRWTDDYIEVNKDDPPLQTWLEYRVARLRKALEFQQRQEDAYGQAKES